MLSFELVALSLISHMSFFSFEYGDFLITLCRCREPVSRLMCVLEIFDYINVKLCEVYAKLDTKTLMQIFLEERDINVTW